VVRWTIASLIVALVAVGCGPQFVDAPAPRPAEPIVVAAVGRVVTSTPVGVQPPLPTPTFNVGFGAILTPLAQTPLPTIAIPPTPTVALLPTRTRAPSVTPFPTISIPPTATRPPLLTAILPPRRPTIARSPIPTNTPVPPPTATPVDPSEPADGNNDLSTAAFADLDTDIRGIISSPTDVDVYRFDIVDDSDENQIVVTLTAQQINLYQLFLISPGRRSAAYGTPVGSVARHIIYPVRGEVGTWYVEISTPPGKRVPQGTYTLRVETR